VGFYRVGMAISFLNKSRSFHAAQLAAECSDELWTMTVQQRHCVYDRERTYNRFSNLSVVVGGSPQRCLYV
jgi:hypothetical protein